MSVAVEDLWYNICSGAIYIYKIKKQKNQENKKSKKQKIKKSIKQKIKKTKNQKNKKSKKQKNESFVFFTSDKVECVSCPFRGSIQT